MKGTVVRRLFFVSLLAAAGCTSYAPTPADVDMLVKVNQGGKPVSGVLINFQPTSGGLPKTMEVADGSALGNMTPGKYAYFVTEGKDKAAFETIPKQYKEASLDRQVEVKGETIELALD